MNSKRATERMQKGSESFEAWAERLRADLISSGAAGVSGPRGASKVDRAIAKVHLRDLFFDGVEYADAFDIICEEF